MTEENMSGVYKEILGVKFDLGQIYDRRYFVKKIYQVLCNTNGFLDDFSVQWRVNAVRYLERLLRSEFRNTRDLRRKVDNYLQNYQIRKGSVGERIKKARKKLGWTQKRLADHFGFKKHVTILNYEKGLRYPPEKVFRWLEEQRE